MNLHFLIDYTIIVLIIGVVAVISSTIFEFICSKIAGYYQRRYVGVSTSWIEKHCMRYKMARFLTFLLVLLFDAIPTYIIIHYLVFPAL